MKLLALKNQLFQTVAVISDYIASVLNKHELLEKGIYYISGNNFDDTNVNFQSASRKGINNAFTKLQNPKQ